MDIYLNNYPEEKYHLLPDYCLSPDSLIRKKRFTQQFNMEVSYLCLIEEINMHRNFLLLLEKIKENSDFYKKNSEENGSIDWEKLNNTNPYYKKEIHLQKQEIFSEKEQKISFIKNEIDRLISILDEKIKNLSKEAEIKKLIISKLEDDIQKNINMACESLEKIINSNAQITDIEKSISSNLKKSNIHIISQISAKKIMMDLLNDFQDTGKKNKDIFHNIAEKISKNIFKEDEPKNQIIINVYQEGLIKKLMETDLINNVVKIERKRTELAKENLESFQLKQTIDKTKSDKDQLLQVKQSVLNETDIDDKTFEKLMGKLNAINSEHSTNNPSIQTINIVKREQESNLQELYKAQNAENHTSAYKRIEKARSFDETITNALTSLQTNQPLNLEQENKAEHHIKPSM